MSAPASAQTDQPTPPRTLRLWPGVLAVVLLWLVRFGLPVVLPEALMFAVLGGLLGGLAVCGWWLFFSRAQRFERWGAAVLVVASLLATSRVLHESVATAGSGIAFYIGSIPYLSLAFVACALVTRNLSALPRRAAMAATILLACGAWTLVRTHGTTGDFDSDYAWRWEPSPEERLLAAGAEEPAAAPPVEAAPPEAETGASWPGFRGPGRDGITRGVRIATDWSASPPVELWRRPIGPGWSSFAVRGDRLYTQEQRGDDELVACHRASSGEPLWRHRDATRFWESNAGPGPRATPTLHGGRVYTLGATGILNALDAGSGALAWSRDVAADVGAEVPEWGFAGSPLVTGEVVVAAAAGQLVAYDLASGEPRWSGPAGAGYSSPQLMTIDGVAQVVLLGAAGARGVVAADGTLLWEHPWPGEPIVQPALTADGDVLVSTTGLSGGAGLRRLAVSSEPGGWTVAERWRSNRLKPYFSDFVVHAGHAFGFDGGILACIDLADGQRSWKGGRYGHGQLILLPDQDLLLVVSEQGELVLVAAVPGEFTELARFAAIEGKTWNHPVLVDDLLLVRNDREMAAFRLPPADG